MKNITAIVSSIITTINRNGISTFCSDFTSGRNSINDSGLKFEDIVDW